MKSIRELAIREKRIFIRTDLNVPMDENQQITDTTRIKASLPTIKHALDHNCRIIIASHLGRPKGEKKPEFSLEPVALKLAEMLDHDVVFFEDCVGMGAQQMVRDLKPGNILVLENLRFYSEETENDSSFAREMAKLCDIYINDAFGVSHRKHASVHALPAIVETKGMGFLVEKEIKEIGKLLDFRHGDRFTAILGGAKVSDKIGIIRALLDSVDTLVIGGAMAYTFLAAKGITLGKSLVEKDKVDVAREIMKGAEARKVKILLPVDHIAANNIDSTETAEYTNENFPSDLMAFDIGLSTVNNYLKAMLDSHAVFWNGPMGVFEKDQFANGSLTLAKALAESSVYSIAGGGDSVALMSKAGVTERINHISTGGGASLELIKNKTLPGIEILK